MLGEIQHELFSPVDDPLEGLFGNEHDSDDEYEEDEESKFLKLTLLAEQLDLDLDKREFSTLLRCVEYPEPADSGPVDDEAGDGDRTVAPAALRISLLRTWRCASASILEALLPVRDGHALLALHAQNFSFLLFLFSPHGSFRFAVAPFHSLTLFGLSAQCRLVLNN